MTDVQIMEILKMDLQINAEQYDKYLDSLVALAKSAISREGIKIEDTVEDGMLIEIYAAYLYRKRKEELQQMPKMLRHMLNNRLFSQKAGE